MNDTIMSLLIIHFIIIDPNIQCYIHDTVSQLHHDVTILSTETGRILRV